MISDLKDPKTLDAAMAEIDRILNRRKLEMYEPYPKQVAFHAAGAEADVRERLLMAANQVGKTVGAGSETAYHLTGEYPDWWDGIRWEKPVAAWAGSDTAQNTRDNPQRILLGRPGEWGTGMIPAKSLIDIKRNPHGVPDSVETILVRHKTGGISTLTFKSYDQGRKRWQGETLHFVWFDEEPPLDVYMEGLTRTNATQGITFLTFTPLQGMSDVVRRFLIEKVPGTRLIQMAIEDAPHYTPSQRAAIIASYPEHEREARAKGIPVMGSGRVFPIAEERLREASLELPAHWPRIVGLDIGWDHPTAAVWLAWDRDADCVHLYDAYRLSKESIVIHASAIRNRGSWIPVAWPHDGLQHEKGGECKQIAQQYRDEGVNMLVEHATHPPEAGKVEGSGGFAREAGIQTLFTRMQTGRLKVAAHLNDWWEEFRLYHRKDGKIVDVGDDLMSATRVGVMMLRKAEVHRPKDDVHIDAYMPSDMTAGVLG